MSDNDQVEISETHLEAQRQDRERFELTRKGQAGAVGIIATNAAPADDFSPENKADKDHDSLLTLLQLLQLLDEWQSTMSDLQTQMQDVLDKAAESLEHITQMQNLRDNWDFAHARNFFSDTYNQDISRMSEDAALQHLSDTMDRETLAYARYMIEAREIERTMKAHLQDPAFLAATAEQQHELQERFMYEGLQRMEALNSQADNAGVNIEEAGNRLRERNDWNSQLYQDTHSEISSEEYDKYPNDFDTKPFADLAINLCGSFNDAVKASPKHEPTMPTFDSEVKAPSTTVKL